MNRACIVLLLAVPIAGCANDGASTASRTGGADGRAVVVDPGEQGAGTDPSGEALPAVSKQDCRPDIAPEGLGIPDQGVVERTRWTLELVGSCRVASTYAERGVSFMDGWAGVPADSCGNHQSGRFTADGRAFHVDPEGTATTTAYCDNAIAAGDLVAVRSWGIDEDDRVLLLDEHGLVVFAATPDGPPGCVVDVPPNGRRIAAHGEAGCDTSGMPSSLVAG